MDALTQKQADCLAFIQRFKTDEGFSPSSDDIREHFGWKSGNSAVNHLRALEKKGMISRLPGCARAIKVLACLALLFCCSLASADYIQMDEPLALRMSDGTVLAVLTGDCFPLVELAGGKVRYWIGDWLITTCVHGFRVVRDNAAAHEWERLAVARMVREHESALAISRMSDAQLNAALLRERQAIERGEAAYQRAEALWNQQTQDNILFELRRINRR
jgi:hypothetical protein